ncbi:MAG: glycosyltransferase [Candidatus Krumholzibacteriota bacterium]|nr:glycosyltransferase [Candidatus Krumholzibacteriota bacterium]
MDLSIIIITHNSLVPVEKCLESLEACPPSGSYETIVIDNASSDGCADMIEESFPRCMVIRNEENRGYSRGVNQGIDLSISELILILNPDIEVRDGSIDRLARFMNDNRSAGMAGSKLLYPDGRLQYSCRAFYTIKALFLRRTFLGRIFPKARALREHLMIDYDHEQARKVDWLIGACLMVRREAIEKVGKMDERFFLYFEDTDWCYRMNQHGWDVYYIPDSVMTHRYERSSARSVFKKPFLMHLLSLLRYYEKWNKIFYFFRRHRGALKSIIFAASDLVAANAGFFIAYYLRGLFQSLFTNSLYPLDWYAFFIYFYNFIFFFTFLFGGLYQIRRETGAALEFSRVARSVFASFAILLGATYLTRIRIYSRAVLGGQALLSLILVFGFRRIIRLVHNQLVRASFDLKRVILAGDEDEVERFRGLVQADPHLGIDVVGDISGGPGSIGKMEDLESIIDRFKIQEVLILPSYVERGLIFPFLCIHGTRMLEIRIVSPVARFMGREVRVQKIGDSYMFSIERGTQFLLLRLLQRLSDIVTGAVFLPLSAVCLFFFRISGTAGRKASVFSEKRTGYREKTIDWPRIMTRSGREGSDMIKPALWADLLFGRLALVGPPPSPVSDDGGHAGPDGGMRPGISGRWRISPEADWKKSFENEVIETRTRSITDYLEILFRSVGMFFSGRYPEWYFNKGDNP